MGKGSLEWTGTRGMQNTVPGLFCCKLSWETKVRGKFGGGFFLVWVVRAPGGPWEIGKGSIHIVRLRGRGCLERDATLYRQKTSKKTR